MYIYIYIYIFSYFCLYIYIYIYIYITDKYYSIIQQIKFPYLRAVNMAGEVQLEPEEQTRRVLLQFELWDLEELV